MTARKLLALPMPNNLTSLIVRANASPKMKSGWRWVKFGDVVGCVNDTVADPQAAGIERIVGLDHLDPGSLHIKRWAAIEEGTTFTRRFRSGQVLFGKRRAYQRKLAVAEFDGICSGDILVFEPKDDSLVPELLPFIMQAERFWQHALDTSAGSLSPRTKWQDLARYEFALPPKEEQRRIAEILWAADVLAESLKTVLQRVSNSAEALLHEELLRAGASERKIGELGEIVTGATPPTSRPECFGPGFPFVTPGDIADDLYVPSTERTLTETGLGVVREIPKDAVMVVCIGSTVGKVAIAATRCATNQQINSVICGDDINPYFLCRVFRKMGDLFKNSAGCTAVPILNKGDFADLPISIPGRKDQETIIQQLKSIDIVEQLTQDHVARTLKLKRELLSNFLAEDAQHV